MMPQRTKEALEESIQHWKRMKALTVHVRQTGRTDESPAGVYCALCRIFSFGNGHCQIKVHNDVIETCPVMQRTGLTGCVGTPWWDARVAFSVASQDVWELAAQKMIDFLESLREA